MPISRVCRGCASSTGRAPARFARSCGMCCKATRWSSGPRRPGRTRVETGRPSRTFARVAEAEAYAGLDDEVVDDPHSEDHWPRSGISGVPAHCASTPVCCELLGDRPFLQVIIGPGSGCSGQCGRLELVQHLVKSFLPGIAETHQSQPDGVPGDLDGIPQTALETAGIDRSRVDRTQDDLTFTFDHRVESERGSPDTEP